MIMVHDSAHELLLERIAAGEEIARDERQLLRDCPDCTRIESEMHTLQARMERVAARRREVLASARAAPVPPQWHERLKRPAGGVDTSRRTSPRVAVLAAAGLAAGLALWLWIGRGARNEPQPPAGSGVMLGGQEIEVLAPLDSAPSYGAFRFRVGAQGPGWYTVEVSDPDHPSSEPLQRSPELEAGPEIITWIPIEAEQATWPDRIEWRVTFAPADGSRPVVVGSFSASRSPR